jgi:hypothetical protein
MTDVRAFGSRSGAMAAGLAAFSEILQLRWPATNGGKLVLLHCDFSASVSGTTFTPGSAAFRLSKASGWTVDGTGGTAQTLTGINGKLNSNVGGALIPTLRIASTAALGAGTKTLGEDVAVLSGGSEAALVASPIVNGVFFNAERLLGWPLILNGDEGVAIRASVPATGVWQFVVNLAWGVLS